MATRAAELVLQVIHEKAERRSALSDRELLRRFADRNDQRAFAALFHRHAGLVLGVCRRALSNVHDAEDACQATFLVLARKASGGRWQPSIASWLYATARKVAANARVAARRRTGRENRAAVPEAACPIDQMTSRELLTALDEELDRLSPRYREPLVLCYLEGLTRDEAAQRLRVPFGTLKVRLERGRKRLADALTKRGCALGGGLLAMAAVSSASAASRLLYGVLEAAGGLPTPTVAALAEDLLLPGILKKTALTAIVAVGALVFGVGWATSAKQERQVENGSQERTPAVPAKTVHADVLGDPLPPRALARLGTRRFRAGMWPKHIAATPDGEKLITAGFNLTMAHYLTVWSADTGRTLREVQLPRAAIESIAVLPNGRGFAVVKVSRTGYVPWEFTDENALPPAAVKPNEIQVSGKGTLTASAVSADGRFIAAGEIAGAEGNEGKVHVWDLIPNSSLRAAEPRWTVGTNGGFLGLAFSPDGKRLVGITQQQAASDVGGGGQVIPGKPAPLVNVFIWDSANGAEVLRFDARGGKELRTFIDASGNKSDPYEITAGFDKTMAIAPDGQTLFTLTQAGRASLVDLATGKERLGFDALPVAVPAGTVSIPEPIEHCIVTADGHTLIATRGMNVIAAFDAGTGRKLWASSEKRVTSVQSLATLPDGKRFVIGHYDGSLLLCDSATGKVLNEQPGHRGFLSALSVTDGGRSVITCGGDGTARRWDLASGKEVGVTTLEGLHSLYVKSLAPDGRTALGRWSHGLRGPVGLIDTGTGKLIAQLTGMPMSHMLRPVAWLADESVIVADGEDKAHHFGRDGRKRRTFTAPDRRQINTGVLAPDGKSLVLAGEGPPTASGSLRMRSSVGWVGIFELQSGQCRQILEFPNQFTGAPTTVDRSAVVLCGTASSQDGRPDPAAALVLLDPDHGKLVTPFAAPDSQARLRFADRIAMAPTGHQLAVAEVFEKDYSITVYETATAAVRQRLRGHRNSIEQLAFTPDGLRLVSASRDGTALVWDVSPPRPTIPPALSPAQRSKLWETLNSVNAEQAYQAMGQLATEPAVTAAFLQATLKPMRTPADEDIDRLVAALDSTSFAKREAAFQKLDAFGSLAVPRVRHCLTQGPGLEMRRRLEAYLKRHDQPAPIVTGPRLRERRCVELLEGLGSVEAVAVLETWSRLPGTPLAQNAAAALRRLRNIN
jgi:RNA polymerase sigma factor (sigma-70 family)